MSAFHYPTDLRAPGALADLFSFHRAVFGGWRMEDDPDGGDQGGDGAQQRGPGSDGDKPLAEMTIEEKAVYFERKANRLGNALKGRADYDAVKAERDQLKASTQSDTEKAIETARAEERTKVASEWQQKVAASELKAALSGRVPADKIPALIEDLNLSRFLTTTGDIDTDKVTTFAAGFTPAAQLDTGQGRQGGHGSAGKADAGRAEAAKRFGKTDAA